MDRERGEAMLAAMVSGFAGMVIEVGLLIAFQVLAGSVYFALSLLTASFMVGLAAGARLWEKKRFSLTSAAIFLVVWSAIVIMALMVISNWGRKIGLRV
jgi:predicted membrane-bound spermidine synthase